MIKLRPRRATGTGPPPPAIPFSHALLDKNLLGAALGNPNPWRSWVAILKGAFGEQLDPSELAIFRELAGGRDPPTERVSEFWTVGARRSGKSRASAAIATFLATFIDYGNVLAKGELGYVLCLSPTLLQAKLVLSYCEAFLRASPILRQKLEAVTATEVRLAGGIVISSHPSSFKSVRGRTILAAILDEIAFFPTEESSLPDIELVRAVGPALSSTRGMLIGISSPYRRTGVLHNRFKNYYGKDDPHVLVIKARTEQLNPTIDRSIIQRAKADDPTAAASEWNAEFRDDLSSFVSREVVEACVTPGCFERPPVPGIHYVGFCDPAGGSGSDSMSIAIGHKNQIMDTIALSAVREVRPPFSPEAVVSEFAALLKTYNVHTVTGDRYAGAWPVEQFSKFGILYQHSEKAKSDLYIDALALLNSARLDLLDHAKLVSQLCSLERRARSGRDSIDRAPGAHDDIANCVAGLASILANKHGSYDVTMRWVRGDDADDERESARAWRMSRLMQHIANHW